MISKLPLLGDVYLLLGWYVALPVVVDPIVEVPRHFFTTWPVAEQR